MDHFNNEIDQNWYYLNIDETKVILNILNTYPI